MFEIDDDGLGPTAQLRHHSSRIKTLVDDAVDADDMDAGAMIYLNAFFISHWKDLFPEQSEHGEALFETHGAPSGAGVR